MARRRRYISTPCVDVSELAPNVPAQRIRVKILRCFESRTLFYETLELILADNKGTKIHAIMRRDVGESYRKTIKEGNCVIIGNFSLEPNIQSPTPTTHPYTIHWRRRTPIHKLRILDNADHFSFVPFEDVKSGELDPNLCIDVVGRVMCLGSFAIGDPLGMQGNNIYIEIENEKGERLECRIPSRYSAEFWDGWKGCVDNIIICIMRFVRIESDHQGSPRVTTASTFTKILFNHQCEAESTLRSYFLTKKETDV